ncbi:MAG: 50S ribosomal protein L11 methyltransferase [Balneolaceae bacterium]
MTWLKLTIQVTEDYHEALVSELVELGFDGFEQFDSRLEAFIVKTGFSDVDREYIEQILAAYPGDNYIETEEIHEKNWNEDWEKSIKPQSIGKFFIRPTWLSVSPPEGEILLEIDPKMSFGTGYHATTKLMLEMLPELSPSGREVLDAGTGSGILAIAAVKLGADSAFGFDTDEWSEINARENALINVVDDRVTIRRGGIETVPDKRYDLILANINRNAISDLLPLFVKHLKKKGTLAVSGLLQSDKAAIRNEATSAELVFTGERGMDEWILLCFEKP